MRLSTKSLVASVATAVVVAAAAFLSSEFIIVRGVSESDVENAKDRMRALLGVVDDDLSRLDDALRAALNAPPRLGPWGIEAPGVQYAVVLNDAGEVRRTRAYVSDADEIIPPETLQLLAREPTMGIIVTDGQVGLVAARDRDGGGIMAVAARLVPTRFATISGVPVVLRRSSNEPGPGEDVLLPVTSVEARINAGVARGGSVEVTAHLREISGGFGPILSATFPIRSTGSATAGALWLLGIIVLASAAALVAANMWIRYGVGGRLREFAHEVRALRAAQGAGRALDTTSRDELHEAAEDVNGLAASLVASRADSARRIAFVRELAAIAERVAGEGDDVVEGAVSAALRTMAAHEGTQRCWWYLADEDGAGFNLKGEWADDGVRAHGTLLRRIDETAYPWIYRQFARGEVVHIARVADLPDEAEPERGGFAAMEAVAVTAAPVRFGGRIAAVIGIDTTVEEKTWSEGAVTELKVVGHVLVAAMEHRSMAARCAAALEEVADAKETADDANSSRTEIMENLSREVRTPVTGVLEMTEMALGTDLSDEQRGYLVAARNSAEAMLGLVDEFLEFSRLDADQLEFEQVDFDVRGTVEGAINSMSHLALEKGLEVLCRVAPEVPSHLRGDPTRLRQIIANLLSNALKFTSKGHVLVDLDLASSSKGMAVMLHGKVTDTGAGIPEEKHATLFDAATGDEQEARPSSGMGLAITRLLVRKMAGRIWLTSAVGEGSTFEFTALVEKSPETTPLDFGADAPKLMKKQRVLVVEDSAENREILRSYVESWGAEVLEAERASEIFPILQRETNEYNPVTGVLLDAELPGAHAADIVQRIGVDVSTGKPGVVVFSALKREADRRPFVEAGAKGHLTKPVKAGELLRALLAVARSRK